MLDIDNGATKVSKSPTIKLQFSESMNITTLNASNIVLHQDDESGLLVPLTNITLGVGNSVVISPTTVLNDNTKYVITVDNVSDVYGNKLITMKSFTFTTSDFVAPTATILNPANNATNISKNPSIKIQFSKGMNFSTLNESNIELRQNSATGNIISLNNINISNNRLDSRSNRNIYPQG